MKKNLLLFFTASFLAASQTNAAVDSLFCDGGEVRRGTSIGEVLSRCGEPDSINGTATKTYRKNRKDKPVGTERWFYDFGPQRFTATVKFNRGSVSDIYHHMYGKKKADLNRNRDEEERPEMIVREPNVFADPYRPMKMGRQRTHSPERVFKNKRQEPNLSHKRSVETPGRICECDGVVLLTDGPCPCKY